MSSLLNQVFKSGKIAAFAGLHSDKALMEAAARDTALRTRVGSLFYLVVFCIVIAASPFYPQHPRITVAVGAALLIGTLVRVVYVWGFESLYPRGPRMWLAMSSFGVLTQAMGWGVFCILSIHYYGWQWPTMITCLSAAAFSAGAAVTLSPIRFLPAAFLVLILAPTLVFSLLGATQQSVIAAFLFGTYIIFLILVSSRLNREYWNAKLNVQLLDKRARELAKKNRELESFAYSVSHDLRTPLRAIDGYSRFLLDDAGHKLDETESLYLSRIRSAAQRMDRLIDDLLQLSRVSKGTYQPRDVDLSRLVAENFAKLKKREPERNVVLEIEPRVHAVADPALIDIAVQNLAENAWKYSSDRCQAKIRFGAKRKDEHIVYFMKNDGAGFDPRYRDKLFKPFERLHREDEYPGTGIGLATVARVIERHNGTIWANAKVDKGATFYFTLPAAEPA